MNATVADTAAPPSFAGMDWLFVVNLGMAALGFLVLSFAARDIWRTWLAVRAVDPKGSAPELMFRVLTLVLTGATCRALSDGLSLYGYDPLTRSSGGWATASRFLDPMGFALMIWGVVILLLTKRGLLGQLRTPPPFMPIWEGRDIKARLAIFAACAMGLALCPVLFR